MKKAISYMACSMAAMLALSACGSAASSASTVASSSDAASTESTAASEASNEPVTITFAQYSGSGDNEQYLQQMVDNYMKENPNVTIDLQTYGYDDYFTQMTAKVSGGQAPDVFELDYQNFVSYAKKGALMPLDDILTKDGIDTSIYNDMALKAFSADGVQYGVPDSFSNVVLIYNKDLFDQAGIDYPTDDWKWEDAMAAAEKIRHIFFADPCALDIDTSRERREFCRKACAAHQIDFTEGVPAPLPPGSAIFAVNDPAALRYLHCGVPLFSIDGTPEAQAAGIVSCRQPMEKLAKACFQALRNQRKQGETWVAHDHRIAPEEPKG